MSSNGGPKARSQRIISNGAKNGVSHNGAVKPVSLTDRKSNVLDKLKQEREDLVKNKIVSADDSMVKRIDRELKRHGVAIK